MTKLSKRKTPVARFDYHLPPELISQKPAQPRDRSRLLVLPKNSGALTHQHFFNLAEILKPGDVLVLNNSKVIPARLIGKKATGGKIEIFLLQKAGVKKWLCLIGGQAQAGDRIYLAKNIVGKIIKKSTAENIVSFNVPDKKLLSIGRTPLPPYIHGTGNIKHGTNDGVLPDYQTVYAKHAGSVAAPTAGLHFTKSLLHKLKRQGVQIEYLTLHVGLGTFQPVKTKHLEEHRMHAEYATLDKKTASRLNQAKKAGGKIIAVGNTSVRTLEAFTDKNGCLQEGSRWINIFIYPGYKFKFVDGVITNFHLPKSTLLMLVSALAGEKNIQRAYATAIKKKYRFYSFGDAMMII